MLSPLPSVPPRVITRPGAAAEALVFVPFPRQALEVGTCHAGMWKVAARPSGPWSRVLVPREVQIYSQHRPPGCRPEKLVEGKGT